MVCRVTSIATVKEKIQVRPTYNDSRISSAELTSGGQKKKREEGEGGHKARKKVTTPLNASMEANSATAAAIAQYLESTGYRDIAQRLRREAKVAPAEEVAAAANKDNGAIRTCPRPRPRWLFSVCFSFQFFVVYFSLIFPPRFLAWTSVLPQDSRRVMTALSSPFLCPCPSPAQFFSFLPLSEYGEVLFPR